MSGYCPTGACPARATSIYDARITREAGVSIKTKGVSPRNSCGKSSEPAEWGDSRIITIDVFVIQPLSPRFAGSGVTCEFDPGGLRPRLYAEVRSAD